MEDLAKWMPVLENLVWPFFIIILLIIFKGKVNALFQMATEGRSLEIGGWLKIGEQVKEIEIQDFATDNAVMDAVEGEGIMVVKGGNNLLNRLQEQLKRGEIHHIDILNITDHKYYYKEMLLKYVSNLSIKYIVFTSNGTFKGWMESSVFSSQLLMSELNAFDYSELNNALFGIKTEQVSPTTKTFEVLKYMKEIGVDVIPIVDNDEFKYFVNRSDILTNIISSNILNKADGK